VAAKRTKDFLILVHDIGKAAIGCASHTHLDHHSWYVPDMDSMAFQEPHHQLDICGDAVTEIK
jgi:hypothetical protein